MLELPITEFVKYLLLGFSSLLPLINPPGSALELLGVVGIGPSKPYKILARKVALNTVLFLAVIALAGPYILQFFGISVEILQCVGGAILIAMGWQLLNKPEQPASTTSPAMAEAAQECVATYWKTRAFYPLTFPITVGPGSVAVMLTLSAQAKGVVTPGAILPALAGLFASVLLLSLLVYFFYAYAPAVAQRFPVPIVNGTLRIVAFLLICIGAQIAWHGLQTLLRTAHT